MEAGLRWLTDRTPDRGAAHVWADEFTVHGLIDGCAGALPGGTVIEIDRMLDAGGTADVGGHRVEAGPELASRKVTLRLNGHLIHVVADSDLAKTLPSPNPRQRLRVGASYAGKIVTVHVEDTNFRVTYDGTEISLHPRTEQRPVTRWKLKFTPRKPQPRPASPETANQVMSRNCQNS